RWSVLVKKTTDFPHISSVISSNSPRALPLDRDAPGGVRESEGCGRRPTRPPPLPGAAFFAVSHAGAMSIVPDRYPGSRLAAGPMSVSLAPRDLRQGVRM